MRRFAVKHKSLIRLYSAVTYNKQRRKDHENQEQTLNTNNSGSLDSNTGRGGLFPESGESRDDGRPHEKACTVESVAGAYGAIGGGTFLPGNAVGIPPGAFATVGR